MVDLTGIVVVSRAYAAAWRGQGARMRARLARSRHILISAALVIAGLAGALGGGALIGRWCLGLVLLAESAGAIWLGLNRDDGHPLPRRGERTIADVAEEYRRLPQLGLVWAELGWQVSAGGGMAGRGEARVGMWRGGQWWPGRGWRGQGGPGRLVFHLAADDGGRDAGAAFQFGQPRLGGLLPLFLGT